MLKQQTNGGPQREREREKIWDREEKLDGWPNKMKTPI